MGGKKFVFLFLALLLPVLVFVFLKFFGKNEFDVPLLYEKGIGEKPADCNLTYDLPYVLHDSIYQLFAGASPAIVIASFYDESGKVDQLERKYAESNVKLVNQEELKLNDQDLTFLKNCYLLIKPSQTIVLIDDQKRIRGYYDGSDREDIDRLEAEIKIILKKY